MRWRKIQRMVREVAEAHGELRRQLAAEKEAVLEKDRERVEEELAATTREAEDYWEALTGEKLKGLPEMSAWERSKLAARRVAGVLFTIVDIPLGAWLWASALLIDVAAVCVLLFGIYYPNNHRNREYLFTLFMFNVVIFHIGFLLKSVEL